MRVKRVHIERYGMFADTAFEWPSSGVQLLYGPNEAGKSTVMRFIREVLFGFTPQSPRNSESSGTFGGRLTVDIPKEGTVTIERMGSKGRGHVRVYKSDGRISGEDALTDLLPGLDASIFRAIFSFGLDGLQGLESVKADEFNDYLFHAGMTGDFSIRELQHKLAKKQAELFKPQGKKPRVNRQLAELDALEDDIILLQRKNDGYRELEEESKTVRRRLAGIKETKAQYQKNIRFLEKQNALVPHVKEKQELQIRLEQLGNYEPFPEDGLSRFDHWRTQAVALEAEKDELRAKKEAIEEKLASIEVEVHDEWLMHKEDVRREQERQSLMQSRVKELAAQEHVVQAENEEIQDLLQKLGSPWTEESVQAANTGLGAKERLKENVREREHLQNRRRVLEEEKTRLEITIQKIRTEQKEASGKRLTDKERAQLEELVRRKEQRGRSGDPGNHASRPHMRNVYGNIAFFGWGVLSVIFVFWAAANKQWWIAGAATILALATGFYLRKMQGPSGMGKQAGRTGERVPGEPDSGIEEVENAKLTLQEDNRLRRSEEILRDRLIHNEKAHDDVAGQLREIDGAMKNVDSEIQSWCEAHRFPPDIRPSHMVEVFERAEEAKPRLRRRDRANETCRKIKKEIQERENELKRLCNVFGLRFDGSAEALVQMSERIEKQEEVQSRKEQLQENIKEYEQQIQSLQGKINRYYGECEALMREAEAETEDAYRRKGKAWQEGRGIFEHLSKVDATIEALVPNKTEREKMVCAVFDHGGTEDAEVRRLEAEIGELEQEEQELFEQLASITEQKKRLEEGSTYAEQLHRFERKKDVLYSDVRRWAVYRTAGHLLQKAKEQYRDKRLPKVVKAASRHFSSMTQGRYSAVFSPEEEGFAVERAKDGKRFSPEQLSRGTAEQLYLALRLALARIYESPSPYPIIMDDILVNFDAFRTEKAVETIREVSRYHQILMFTCHEHLLKYFRNDEVISMEHGGNVPLSK